MQDVLLSIQTGKTVDDPTRMKFETQEFYLKDARTRWRALFPDAPGGARQHGKDRRTLSGRVRRLESTILPEFDAAGRRTSLARISAEAVPMKALTRRYPDGRTGTVQQASAVRDRHDREDGLYRLLPHRVGFRRALRNRPGHPGRPRARHAPQARSCHLLPRISPRSTP